jgi:hypothetical protein
MRSASVTAVLCAALAACGSSPSEPPGREPAPPPRVALSEEDRAAWESGTPAGASVPVLVYRRVEREAFARQMALLDHAGYETISLGELARHVRREPVSLPPRPMVVTFDGGRLDDWTRTDGTLRERGFGAVVFVDVGRVEVGDRAYLTWAELNRLHRSGRWDVQLLSGTGNQTIRYGPGSGDVGPFYAYRGTEEVLGGWRERVFSDITYGEDQLAHHVRGYRPLAFAPPHGNYGQLGTNDRRIPRELLARLLMSFALVFTQDGAAPATPGARNPLERIEVGPGVSEAELRRQTIGAATPGDGAGSAGAASSTAASPETTSVTRSPNSSSITTTSPRAIGLPLTSRSTGSPARRLRVTIDPGPSARVSRIVIRVRPISTASSTGTS